LFGHGLVGLALEIGDVAADLIGVNCQRITGIVQIVLQIVRRVGPADAVGKNRGVLGQVLHQSTNGFDSGGRAPDMCPESVLGDAPPTDPG
jgi:hypothetical protein